MRLYRIYKIKQDVHENPCNLVNLVQPIRIKKSPFGHKVLPSGVNTTIYAGLNCLNLPRPSPVP